MSYVIQRNNSTAFQNIHLQVPMGRYTSAGHYLLRPDGQVLRACGHPNLDEDISAVTKVNEMLPALGAST